MKNNNSLQHTNLDFIESTSTDESASKSLTNDINVCAAVFILTAVGLADIK